jgi:hypothetical protein
MDFDHLRSPFTICPREYTNAPVGRLPFGPWRLFPLRKPSPGSLLFFLLHDDHNIIFFTLARAFTRILLGGSVRQGTTEDGAELSCASAQRSKREQETAHKNQSAPEEL